MLLLQRVRDFFGTLRHNSSAYLANGMVGEWSPGKGKSQMAEAEPLSGEIEFRFEKSNLFRVIYIDGAIGGASPGNRLIHMSVYSERTPIPQAVFHPIKDGIPGPEDTSKRLVRSGIFREVEADLVMSADTAIAIRNWLDERIRESKKMDAMAAAALGSQQK